MRETADAGMCMRRRGCLRDGWAVQGGRGGGRKGGRQRAAALQVWARRRGAWPCTCSRSTSLRWSSFRICSRNSGDAIHPPDPPAPPADPPPPAAGGSAEEEPPPFLLPFDGELGILSSHSPPPLSGCRPWSRGRLPPPPPARENTLKSLGDKEPGSNLTLSLHALSG